MKNVLVTGGDGFIAKMAAWVKTLQSVPQPKRFGHIEVLKTLPPAGRSSCRGSGLSDRLVPLID